MSTASLPLYVLFLIKALREEGTSNVLLASTVFLVALLSNPYYVIFLILFTGLYVLFHRWQLGHAGSRSILIKRFALVVACTAVLSLPIAALFLRMKWPDIVLSTPLAEVNQWSADLMGLFPSQPLSRALVESGGTDLCAFYREYL
jgi:uncharacterized membrane protein YfhO